MRRPLFYLVPICFLSALVSFVFHYCWRTRGPVAIAPNLIDFGVQESGRRVHTSFTIANRGRAPLRLSEPHTSCGCLSARPVNGDRGNSEDPLIILPGQGLELQAGLIVRGES